MARPSEIETKTVSVRLPMASYIRILQEAVGKNLSLSEYLTLKILGDGSATSVRKQSDKRGDPFDISIPDLDMDVPEETRLRTRVIEDVEKEKAAEKRQKSVKKTAISKSKQPVKLEALTLLDDDPQQQTVPTNPTPPVPPRSAAELRKMYRGELANLGRRLAGYRSHNNQAKVREIEAQREAVQKELDKLKGKRK